MLQFFNCQICKWHLDAHLRRQMVACFISSFALFNMAYYGDIVLCIEKPDKICIFCKKKNKIYFTKCVHIKRN